MTELTLEEQEKILLIAHGYIKAPENWIRGKWKCPLYEQTPSGRIRKEGGEPVQATDENNRPLFQYCIEGAVNQATIDVLGEEHAIRLKAAQPGANGLVLDVDSKYSPTEQMGLNAISRAFFGVGAMEYNDDSDDGHEATHRGVLKILSTRLKEVRRLLRHTP